MQCSFDSLLPLAMNLLFNIQFIVIFILTIRQAIYFSCVAFHDQNKIFSQQSKKIQLQTQELVQIV